MSTIGSKLQDDNIPLADDDPQGIVPLVNNTQITLIINN